MIQCRLSHLSDNLNLLLTSVIHGQYTIPLICHLRSPLPHLILELRLVYLSQHHSNQFYRAPVNLMHTNPTVPHAHRVAACSRTR